MSQFTRNRSKRISKTAFTKCFKCHKEDLASQKPPEDSAKQDSEASTIHGFISTIESRPSGISQRSDADSSVSAFNHEKRRVTLDHHIFTSDGWRRATSLSHPILRLRISVKREDYKKFGLVAPYILPKHTDTVADSEAMSCLWSRHEFLRCGF